MLTVYLLRHGETTYNADGNRYCGHTDANLTAKGFSQAKEVFELLKDKKIDAVYASPLKRARITAEIATNRQVITDNRLIEIDFGNWEGKTKEEFLKEDPASWEQWIANPSTAIAGRTGESGDGVVRRVNAFFNEMVMKHQHQTIVIVAHNGVNRLFMASRLGMPLKNYRSIAQENSSITMFQITEEDEFILHKLNAK